MASETGFICGPYHVPGDGSSRVADVPTRPPKGKPSKRVLERRLEASVDELDELQRRLYADDRHAVLLIFQTLDAAGTARCATVWR